ncbi:hypothetical protein M0805_008842 [Coniferiporia weirii]|nr:hypothetical protein M0805_008842 [Coniferiporia weirii]
MSNVTTLDPAVVEYLLGYVEGYDSAKFLAFSSLALIAYDHITCLDQEFEFFWKGDWSLTRVLYFLNRYLPPLVFILQLFCKLARVWLFASLDSQDSPHRLPQAESFFATAIRTSVAFELVGMFIIEAVLATRVYYMWAHSRPVQYALCTLFTVCIAVAIGFAGRAIHALRGAHLPVFHGNTGCINRGDGLYWPIYLPTFIFQTVLFGATLFRILRRTKTAKNKALVTRLLHDGGLFYFVVLACVLFTGVGSLLVDHPKIAVPALASNFSLAIQSICASHLILNIHSLAADMGSDPKFLLSNIEISRIAARPGKNPNELVVDIGGRGGAALNSPVESPDFGSSFMGLGALRVTCSRGPMTTSRVGLFDYASRVESGKPSLYVQRGKGW